MRLWVGRSGGIYPDLPDPPYELRDIVPQPMGCDPIQLTVIPDPGIGGTTTGTGTYPECSQAIFSATANPGWFFDGFSGDLSGVDYGTDPTTGTVLMCDPPGDRVIYAHFSLTEDPCSDCPPGFSFDNGECCEDAGLTRGMFTASNGQKFSHASSTDLKAWNNVCTDETRHGPALGNPDPASGIWQEVTISFVNEAFGSLPTSGTSGFEGQREVGEAYKFAPTNSELASPGPGCDDITVYRNCWNSPSNPITRYSPVIVDVDGLGYPDLLAGPHRWTRMHPPSQQAADYRAFSIAPGGPQWIEWVGPKAGVLVHSSKGIPSGRIDARSLFGNFTFGLNWENGYEALAQLDSDLSGQLEGSELDEVFVWQDANGNAEVDLGEAVQAGSLFSSIATVPVLIKSGESKDYWNPDGITFLDGSTSGSWDWWPAVGTHLPVLEEGSTEPLIMYHWKSDDGKWSGYLRFIEDQGNWYVWMAQGDSPTIMGSSVLIRSTQQGEPWLTWAIRESLNIIPFAWTDAVIEKGVLFGSTSTTKDITNRWRAEYLTSAHDSDAFRRLADLDVKRGLYNGMDQVTQGNVMFPQGQPGPTYRFAPTFPVAGN